MRRSLAFLAFAILAAIAASTRAHGQEILWKVMTPWYVHYDPKFGGCEAFNVFAKEKIFRIGYYGEGDTYHFMFAARDGELLPPAATSEVFLNFEPGGRIFAYASGQTVGKSEKWKALLFRALPQDVLKALGRTQRLKIEHERKIVADIDLTGLGPAMSEFHACNKARASK